MIHPVRCSNAPVLFESLGSLVLRPVALNRKSISRLLTAAGREKFLNTEVGYDELAIDGHNYDGTSCHQGVNVASGSTITWHTDGSDTSSGWEICFRAN
jgi:hypothetical protein